MGKRKRAKITVEVVAEGEEGGTAESPDSQLPTPKIPCHPQRSSQSAESSEESSDDEGDSDSNEADSLRGEGAAAAAVSEPGKDVNPFLPAYLSPPARGRHHDSNKLVRRVASGQLH